MNTRFIGAVVFWGILLSVARAESPVEFPDKNLKAAVEKELWVSDPTPSDMLGLTYLQAGSQEIASLKGLEYAKNLQTLRLTHNKITSISPLSGLSALKTLVLNNNQISSITTVSSLDGLEHLDIHGNDISSISAVSGLTNLQTLILRINRIQSISAVSSLVNLRQLDLGTNQISSIGSLSGLTNLETLYLYSNEISSISSLAPLKKLRKVELRNNQISSISTLSQLTQLEHIDAGRNQISTLPSLASLTSLKRLYLFSNQISDISPLTNLTSLKTLDLRWNPLSDTACTTYIPRIIANNPDITFSHDLCVLSRLVISSTAGGSVVSPGEGVFDYSENEEVLLQAQANPGFVFDSFTGSFATSQNPVSVTVSQEYDIRANFLSRRETLYVDDDAMSDPGPTNVNVSDPGEDGTAEHPFDKIQEAIEVATNGTSILVQPGRYRQTIDLLGKCVHLQGVDPNAPGYPILDGSGTGPVVSFTRGEDPNCVLTGFIITGGEGNRAGAIYCSASSPAIANCLIVGNRATATDGAAITCCDSNAVLVNCTVADNDGGPSGGAILMIDSNVTLLNCIVWGNSPRAIGIADDSTPVVSYTDAPDDWPGTGNFEMDPLFVQPGYWYHEDDATLVVPADNPKAVWADGDYHLRSLIGRWSPDDTAWVIDEMHSPCIDAGDPANRFDGETVPNGARVNLGAYGGTTQASLSP